MKDYYQAEWVALNNVTTSTTSSSKEMMAYDYAELEVDSTTTTAWSGTVQIQGSIDNSTFYNYGDAVTAEGFYIIDPLPRYIRVVGTRDAGRLLVHVKPVMVK